MMSYTNRSDGHRPKNRHMSCHTMPPRPYTNACTPRPDIFPVRRRIRNSVAIKRFFEGSGIVGYRVAVAVGPHRRKGIILIFRMDKAIYLQGVLKTIAVVVRRRAVQYRVTVGVDILKHRFAGHGVQHRLAIVIENGTTPFLSIGNPIAVAVKRYKIVNAVPVRVRGFKSKPLVIFTRVRNGVIIAVEILAVRRGVTVGIDITPIPVVDDGVAVGVLALEFIVVGIVTDAFAVHTCAGYAVRQTRTAVSTPVHRLETGIVLTLISLRTSLARRACLTGPHRHKTCPVRTLPSHAHRRRPTGFPRKRLLQT